MAFYTITKNGKTQTIHFNYRRGVKPPPPCVVCGGPGNYLCDWPKNPKAKTLRGQTCSKPLCGSCAIDAEDDKDYCPEHFKGSVRVLDAPGIFLGRWHQFVADRCPIVEERSLTTSVRCMLCGHLEGHHFHQEGGG